MRLRRFDLIRYGHFTDFHLDLGPHKPGRGDFHIVYGPNEAGKSTIFAAYLDLLFGMEMQTPYNFLHDYRALRVGALLEEGEQTVELHRLKRSKNSLVKPDDTPAAAWTLETMLRPLDRNAYVSMLSLDDDSLQAGGESILKNQGHLGHLLFSATSGLAELGHVLEQEREAAGAFHRSGARNTDLRRHKEELRDLRRRSEAADLSARGHRDLQEAYREAAARHAQVSERLAVARTALRRVRQTEQALDPWRAYRALCVSASCEEPLPEPAAGALDEAQELHRELAALTADEGRITAEAERIAEQLRHVTRDEAALAAGELVDALAEQGVPAAEARRVHSRQRERLRARTAALALHLGLVRDPPVPTQGANVGAVALTATPTAGHVTEDRPAESSQGSCRSACSNDEPACEEEPSPAQFDVEQLLALLPTALDQDRLVQLAERYDQLQSQRATIQTHLDEAQALLNQIVEEEALHSEQDLAANLEALRSLRQEMRATAIPQQLQVLGAKEHELQGALQAALASLAPWNGERCAQMRRYAEVGASAPGKERALAPSSGAAKHEDGTQPPSQGCAAILRGLTLPELTQVDRWQQARSRILLQCESVERDLRTTRHDARAAEASRKTLASHQSVSTEELWRYRAQRRDAWCVLRARIDELCPTNGPGFGGARGVSTTAGFTATSAAGESSKDRAATSLVQLATRFEAAVQEEERAVQRFAAESHIRGRLQEAQMDDARLQARLAELEEEQRALHAELEGLDAELRAELDRLELPAEWSCERLSTWLERAVDARRLDRELQSVQHEQSALSKTFAEFYRRMHAGLMQCAHGLRPEARRSAAVDVEATWHPAAWALMGEQLDRWVEECRALQVERSNLQRSRDSACRRLTEAEAQLTAWAASHSAWEAQWRNALARTWLAHRSPPPATVRRLLPLLEELRSLATRTQEARLEEEALRDKHRRWFEMLQRVEQDVGEVAADHASPQQRLRHLQARVAEARQRELRRLQILREQERWHQELRQVGIEGLGRRERLAQMGQPYGAFEPEPLIARLKEALEQAQKRAQLRALERSLSRILGVDDIALVQAALHPASQLPDAEAQLATEAQSLELEIQSLEQQLSESFHAKATLRNKLDSHGDDASAAELESARQALLLQVEDEALRYLERSLGARLIDRALMLYRHRHRSTLMRGAAQAFRAITCGRFSDLRTAPGREGERLVAMRAAGGSLLAAEMSKGTRFQLYLALRIAGYREFATRRSPLPLVADDIMETFDDDRAAAALRELAALSHVGQVLYLTHHPHLVELARSSCGGDLTVHRLDAFAGASQSIHA